MRLLVLVLLLPTSALAHSFGKSFSDLKPIEQNVSVFFDFDPDDLEETLRARFDPDHSGIVDVPEMEAQKDALSAVGMAGYVVSRGEERCQPQMVSSKISEQARMVRLRLLYACATDGPLTIRVALLESLRDGHVHLATVRLPSGVRGEALTRDRPEFSEVDRGGAVSWRFFVAGVEHILRGYDHLLFLLGLLLVAKSTKQLLLIITSFTVAHSITLLMGGLGVVSLPGSIVEPAIAASIAYVGAENLYKQKAPDWRPVLTFALGLIHGFGFAGVLQEMSLPAEGRVLPLVTFNVGVEVGQLGVVLGALPLLRLGERRFGRAVVVGGSVGVLAAGVIWFVLRVSGA